MSATLLGKMAGSTIRPSARYVSNVSNQRVFDKIDITQKYLKQATGGQSYVATSTGTSGMEYWGPAGGIKFPKIQGLNKNDIIYRVAGARKGISQTEIAKNVCTGDWWISREFTDHLFDLTYNVSIQERTELFGANSDLNLFLQMWRANCAIGMIPEDPYLVKCRVLTPTGIFTGYGNPVAKDYSKEFPILAGSQLFKQAFIPGNKDEDGDWSKPAFTITDHLEVLDLQRLD